MKMVISTPGTTPARKSCPTEMLTMEASSRNPIGGGCTRPPGARPAAPAEGTSRGNLPLLHPGPRPRAGARAAAPRGAGEARHEEVRHHADVGEPAVHVADHHRRHPHQA